ncbi:MAG: phosphoribosylformylglycinamidine synthase subunit PurL [Chloroflexi bacterium]|nr:phosphoribosylformylglycinamidine synthase subunit PurL [Chloroflexota bacterium]
MVTDQMLAEVALTRDEYALLVDHLGREPNHLELGMVGAMWSEHCGYKNSRPLLKLFPTSGARVLQGPGENAGAVDIGDGLAAVFKIESHNHPSAVEPFQGAATGVGGILRDIFTMGARPVALLDALRFGPLDDARTRYLFGGVVAGIAHYGNAIGVPTVGGEVAFDQTYAGNPLVNAMCVGIIEADRLMRAAATGVGNTLILVGADTGRDGILGASFASVDLDENSEERRPAVQVGNPFLEKLLMEACLELLQGDAVVGMQDLGAAGLTSSTVESASRGGAGVEIDVQRVSRRERGMTPYEVMLSESQERMLVVVRRGREHEVRAVFDRWGLHSDVVGVVTDDGLVRVRDGETVVAETPATIFTDLCPTYRREGRFGADAIAARAIDLSDLPDVAPDQAPGTRLAAGEALARLLAAPTVASKAAIFRRYDHTIGTNTVIGPGEGDAAVVRVKGTRRALALSTDCNSRYCWLDPHQGGAHAVAEAARNVVCVGATPLAITNNLNFGNPTRPEVYYQLEGCIRGMAEACQYLETPVVSGNVSLYNESGQGPILPTPVVGMVGLLEDVNQRVGLAFPAGCRLLLLGAQEASLGASEYLFTIANRRGGVPPRLDLELERRVQAATLAAIRGGHVRAAHDTSEGGLLVALAEGCIAGSVGAHITLDSTLLARAGGRLDAALFGEAGSRVIVAVDVTAEAAVRRIAADHGVPVTVLGDTGGDRVVVTGLVDRSLTDLAAAYTATLV